MPNLFPDGYEDETITDADLDGNSPIGYRNGIDFDDTVGDFVRCGRNKLCDSTGLDSWKSWVVNCMETERYKHLAYSSDFGIEMDKAFRASTHEEAEAILTREITEAILADPYGRTEYIEDMSFSWVAPDAVEVKATLHGIDDVTIDATAYLTTAREG